jgi:glutamate dehydrogenase
MSMDHDSRSSAMSPEEFKSAVEIEVQQFEYALRWIEEHMSPSFLEEIDLNERMLIARHLLSFSMQDCFSVLHIKHIILVFCLDGPDADLRILKSLGSMSIRTYRTFISNAPPPLLQGRAFLRIALVVGSAMMGKDDRLDAQHKERVRSLIDEKRAQSHNVESLLQGLTPSFLRSMNNDRLKLALELYFQAREDDLCQVAIRKNEDWQKTDAPSLQLIVAWRNVPASHFLFRLAQMIYRHQLTMRRVMMMHVEPYSTDNVLIFSLGLHGIKGGAASEEADIDDLLRELVLLKYFDTEDQIDRIFVQTHQLSGNQAHLVRNSISWIHQSLVDADPNLYSLENVTEALCRHPELTVQLCELFAIKFHPEQRDEQKYFEARNEFARCIDNLDTGHPVNDLKRKNILKQGMHFINFTLKTNFYQSNKSAFAFRLDPQYLDYVPYDRKAKFPELPYGIFFIRGMHFFGFNIRFKDLSRGGMRTVIPEHGEQFYLERNTVFSEAYHLAYTQQKKNKDIPEGGAKTVILLEPFHVFATEEQIYLKELQDLGLNPALIDAKIKIYRRDQKREFLYDSQRAFIANFMTLINCDDEGRLRAKEVVDYWGRPEYIYLGPDENMHNVMIDWIADYSVQCGYRPGRSFMSSKPKGGINHKEYGVTSFGVHVYMQEALLFLGIDPKKDPFTVKISGGPDGDVAGNQILNLGKDYPRTAKLLALVDVSGTIYDPNGLDYQELGMLFQQGLPIRNYPPERLSEGGLLLDLRTKREPTPYVQQTLCSRKQGGLVVQDWLSGNETHHLFRNNVHQLKSDIFIPGGGRPRTLNETNIQSFLDETGKPTAKAIVEGANLYLTPGARRILEKLGTLVFKDSSVNKGGVICSSFEVLASLCLSEEEFVREKEEYVKEVLEIIGKAAYKEARLLLSVHHTSGAYLTEISDQISAKINLFKYQLFDYLETLTLPRDRNHFLIRCLFHYCPPLLQKRYPERILSIPEIHQKAIIACMIAARLVYSYGIEWSPSLIDILPTLEKEPKLFE